MALDFSSLKRYDGDSELTAAVKPTVDMTGVWVAEKGLAEGDNEEVTKLQGISWVQRKMFNAITPVQTFKQNDDHVEISMKMGVINVPAQQLRWDTQEAQEVKEHPPFMKDATRAVTWDEDGTCFHERWTYTCIANNLKAIEHRRKRIIEKDGDKYLTTMITFIPQDSEQKEVTVIRVMKLKKE